MADLNNFFYIDHVHDVLAVYVNRLLAATMRSEYKNVETLAADRELTDADTPIQVFDCDGADRDVLLAEANLTANHPFLIVNDSGGSELLTVKSNDESITYAVLKSGAMFYALPDGSGGYVAVWLGAMAWGDFVEQASAPGTPNSGAWRLYFKSDGAYYKDDAGVETGPLGSGGGGLSNSIASVTTSNVTGVVGTRHILDVSGMTANRNFVLPAGAAGDEIEVHLSVGDATYALILIGNTGISINGETAATEWSRLFISGETVRFVATSTSNWQVVVDGRIPCKTKIKNTGTQNISTSTTTVLTLDELDYDNASCADTANNRIVIRRTNKYIATAGAALDSMTANATRVALFLRAGGSPSAVSEMSALAGGYPSPLPITTAVYAAGTVIDLAISQNCGSTEATYVSNNPTHLEITEVLP